MVTVNAHPGAHGHSATFPPDLIRPRVLSSSPAAGVVLDPFCGTGRALTIAVEHGRTAIGFEMAEIVRRSCRAGIWRMGCRIGPPPECEVDNTFPEV